MADCIFCKIIAGEMPSTKVYEDDEILAINDIAPAAPTHILVMPKKHIQSCADVDAENAALVGRMFAVIARIVKEKGIAENFRVVANNGEDAGQSVPHLHFHILAGREFGWPPG